MGDGHVEKADEADGGQPQTRGQWAQTDPKPFVAGSVVVSGRFGRLVFGGGAVFFAAIGTFAQGDRGKGDQAKERAEDFAIGKLSCDVGGGENDAQIPPAAKSDIVKPAN